jgi:arylsulfatase A
LGVVDDLVHFTDWLPTLLAVAGAKPPRDLHLDGLDVLPLLRGEEASVPSTRFWQWNRYEPIHQCNAAMRDGRWKLVHPALPEAMEVLPADLAQDVALKYGPADGTALNDAALPDRTMPPPPPAQLFDVEADPSEEHDLATSEPLRVARMKSELGTWFEEVEADRRRAQPS